MLRISTSAFLDLGAALVPLKNLQPGKTANDYFLELYNCQRRLQELVQTDFLRRTLLTCQSAGLQLINLIEVALISIEDGEFPKLTESNCWQFKRDTEGFESLLREAMRVADIYFVDQKGAFDTQTLIFNGTAILPAQALIDFPECLEDISDAAMCIAFGLPTSAGIHLMRGLEAIVRRYFDLVADSAGIAAPVEKSLGSYFGIMKRNVVVFNDAKVLFAIEGAKTLHRNPLAHPEERLTIEEAIGLVGLTQNIVSQILRHLDIVVPVQLPPKNDLTNPLDCKPIKHAVQKVTFTKKLINVTLTNGQTLSTPLSWFPNLLNASFEEQQNVEISGDILQWPKLNQRVSVSELLSS